MALCVVVVGNPFDGMTIFGPFATGNEARDWASLNVRLDDWWVVALESQEAA